MNIKDAVKYNVTEAALREMKTKFLPLVINGVEDKDTYELVKSAYKLVQSKFKETDDRRKIYKADALAFGRFVDSEAKRILNPLDEIKEHLKSEKDKYDKEVAEIAYKEEQMKLLPERIAKLAKIGAELPEEDLLKMNDTEFTEAMNLLMSEKIEKENQRQTEEQERLDKEKRDLEIEKQKIEDEKNRQIELEAAKEEAAKRAEERIKIDTENKRLEEVAAEEARIKKEQEELEKKEKNKAYKKWLEENGILPETDNRSYKIERNGNEFTLYKVISRITIK